MAALEKIKGYKNIVIKIGSSLIVDETGSVRTEWLRSLVKDVSELKKNSKNVIIVTSGAIALGKNILNLKKSEKLKLDMAQGTAAVGQIELISAIKNAFSEENIKVAQLLLTIEDTERRRRYLNARNTISMLIDNGVVPIINENDTVATSEIRYGDNDRLASRVAQITDADTLILLSDVDGLYTKNPKIYKDAKLIKKVNDLKKDLKEINIKGVNEYGSGGMQTKIEAAKICQLAGCSMVIANGLSLNPISMISKKNICTWFSSKVSKLDARKKWIISSIAPKGSIIIDDGAKKALRSGKSLLAAGIKKISGKFNKGDHVKILDKKNNECARGLSSFASDEIVKIMGHHSNQIEKLLGYVAKSEVIHKDDMVEI